MTQSEKSGEDCYDSEEEEFELIEYFENSEPHSSSSNMASSGSQSE